MVRKGASSGKQFENELRLGLKLFEKQHPEDFWWMRLADFRDWIVFNKRLRAPKQPADFMALYKGKFFLLECKSTHSKYFMMRYIKPHQKASLLKVQECGGVGLIVYSYRQRGGSINITIDIETYLDVEKHFIEVEKRKSITLDGLLESGIKIPRIRGVGLNTKEIFEAYM